MTTHRNEVTPNPPPEAPALVTYGNLNSKEPIFYLQNANAQALKAIILTAPANIRQISLNTSNNQTLLAEVFRLRQIEATQAITDESQAQSQLLTLLSTTASDIIKMAEDNPAQLSTLMSAAIIADTNLTPREIPTNPKSQAAIAIKWQLEALQQASQIQPSSTAPNHPQQTNPRATLPLSHLLTDTTPPAVIAGNTQQNERSDSSDEDGDHITRAAGRTKPVITPTNFGYGSQATTLDILKHYPGKGISSTSLAVPSLLGPEILSTLIQSGTDIPTFLSNSFKHWKKSPSGQPMNAEMEAVTLGRMIHLEMLCHDSPRQALEQRPSLEVGLRRLYALLYVEETMNNGDYTHKKHAWAEVKEILEITPQGTIMSEDISDSLSKRLASKRRRLTAIKAIRDNIPKRNAGDPASSSAGNTQTARDTPTNHPKAPRHPQTRR